MKWFSILSLFLASLSCAQESHVTTTDAPMDHPSLAMTVADVAQIHQLRGQIPLFEASLTKVKTEVDAEITAGIDTPIPRDYSGGYTHTRHKKNYAMAQQAGALYQILNDDKYAIYVRDMLLQYAAMYAELPLHPKPRSYARGKIFWQSLNDSNWLVAMSLAYDAIYGFLSQAERNTLEQELFRPFADHISVDSPQFFNRIHNHSTWGTAAVGMIGLVMNDDELIQRALYGLDLDNFSDAVDNDGGFIRQAGQKAGFFANLDNAFSPDGYYTEGPYYQRYAMYPYLVFAQSLRNAGYREQAFERHDGVLLKAVQTLIQLSDHDGEFFALNDAQKGMSLHGTELVTAVNIAFQASNEARLLAIAEQQKRVLLDGAGFAVAKAIHQAEAEPFIKASVNLTDGRTGEEGGLAILRADDEALALVFKYTAQGLSHGHYDKLSYSLHERGQEVLQDYGMSRFVNIGQKGGGNYLPENATWAKQSIAHNTLVVNETSHFGGSYQIGSQHHSELDFFNTADPDAHVASAIESNAYPNVPLRRTVAILNLGNVETPIVLDILEARGAEENQYDLPFHYFGQIITTNFPYSPETTLVPLGQEHGYQHLFLEAKGQAEQANTKFTWFDEARFFTLTSISEPTDELLFTRLGANDPEFNLRRDPAFIIRRKAADTLFINTIEPHGSYSPVTELASNASSNIKNLRVALHTDEYLVIEIITTSDRIATFYLAQESQAETQHQLQIGGKMVKWTGSFLFTQKAKS